MVMMISDSFLEKMANQWDCAITRERLALICFGMNPLRAQAVVLRLLTNWMNEPPPDYFCHSLGDVRGEHALLQRTDETN